MTTNTIGAVIVASNAAILASNTVIDEDAMILCEGILICLTLFLVNILALEINGKSLITKIKEWIVEKL